LYLWAAAAAGGAEIRDVMKSAAIDAQLAKLGGGEHVAVHEGPGYAILLAVHAGKPGSEEIHAGADEVLWVRRGTARLQLGDARHEIAAGDFIHVPRGTRHRMDPGAGRIELVVARVFPTGENLPARAGFLAPRRMPDVLRKAQIEATFAKFDANQPLHSAANFTMNYVIYQGRSGPWEAHHGCVDVYFLHVGTARALLGGEILGAKQEQPGEIRGTGVTGARTHQIAPGDLVVIPRNGAHHMQPAGEKLGYLLMKVWVE